MSWSEDYAAEIGLADDALERQEARKNFRKEVWRTKDGRMLPVAEMTDSHLLNAYKHSENSNLFREMVLRLFEQRVAGEKK